MEAVLGNQQLLHFPFPLYLQQMSQQKKLKNWYLSIISNQKEKKEEEIKWGCIIVQDNKSWFSMFFFPVIINHRTLITVH